MNKTAFRLLCIPLAIGIALSQGTLAITSNANCIPEGHDLENFGYKPNYDQRSLRRQNKSSVICGRTLRGTTDTRTQYRTQIKKQSRY